MTHVNDDVLAAIALGEADVDAADRTHVDSCPVCSQEVEQLTHVHGLLREEFGMHEAHRVEPGAQVWQRIATATAVDERGSGQAPGAEVVHLSERAAGASSPARSVPRRSIWLVAAAAACLLVGVLLGRAFWSANEASSQVVATTPLTTLDASRVREGTAALLNSSGTEELRVDTQPMSSPSNGYVEVWLINTDGKRMVSLGVLAGTQGVFPVPANAIAQGYTTVDLSREQYDDQPQHSGDSIMRGKLAV
jgi:Anti-sigma-K factor rskA